MRRRYRNPWGIKQTKCAHLQCDRPPHKRQLCEAHYERIDRGISIATPIRPYVRRPKRPKVCSVYLCRRPQFLDLMCTRHWRHDRLHSPALQLTKNRKYS